MKRTLSVTSALEELHPARITPGICTPVFTAPVHKTSVVNPEENNENALQAEATDLAFYLHRQDKELKPSWTVFNHSLSSDESEQTAVGYFPIILAPAHDFDTLNTAVKRCFLKEADTRLVLHAIHCQFNTVVVASRDTDILLLLVYHFQRMSCEHLWMMCGSSKKWRYTPIEHVFNNLPTGSVSTLLAFQALTGCDTTSYIANHSKRTSWGLFKEHHELLNGLGIGELTGQKIKSSEAFLCRLYNEERADSVDTA